MNYFSLIFMIHFLLFALGYMLSTSFVIKTKRVIFIKPIIAKTYFNLYSLTNSEFSHFNKSRLEILVYNADSDISSINLLKLLTNQRPELKIFPSSLIDKDKYIWTNFCNDIQLDCTILERMYLGRHRLSDGETILKWNELIKANLQNGDKKHTDSNGLGTKLQRELDISLSIVERASYMTRSLQKILSLEKSLDKVDCSPVTIADFAAQALIIDCLSKAFPNDLFIAEEDSTFLQNKAHAEICKYVLDILSSVTDRIWSADELFHVLDKGKYNGSTVNGKIWVLDPIDGTKGFIRGEHFCIGLGLLVDGKPQLSVLGCPNLNLPRALQGISYDSKPIGFIDPPILLNIHRSTDPIIHMEKPLHFFSPSSGSIYFAVTNCGAFAKSLSMPAGAAFEVSTSLKSDNLVLCESAEAAFGNRLLTGKIADILELSTDFVRLDGMCKHCIVGIGAVEGTLRLPPTGYREKIWDHVAGDYFVRESGGQVTDLQGKRLDYTLGRELGANVDGVVVSNGLLHEKILTAIIKAKSI